MFGDLVSSKVMFPNFFFFACQFQFKFGDHESSVISVIVFQADCCEESKGLRLMHTYCKLAVYVSVCVCVLLSSYYLFLPLLCYFKILNEACSVHSTWENRKIESVSQLSHFEFPYFNWNVTTIEKCLRGNVYKMQAIIIIVISSVFLLLKTQKFFSYYYIVTK